MENQKSHRIDILNGERVKCPKCRSVFAVQNDTEILYRNIYFLYIESDGENASAKCKQCKYVIHIDMKNGLAVHIE